MGNLILIAKEEKENIVKKSLEKPDGNSNDLSDNIEGLYNKELVFCKKWLGYTLADPSKILSINELYSGAKGLTEEIEKKIENIDGGKWLNLYQALGTKEVYSSLADFSFDQLFRTNLIQGLLPNNEITGKSSDKEKNKVIEDAMKDIKGILNSIEEKIGNVKNIDVLNMQWNNLKVFKEQMIKFFKEEFFKEELSKSEDMLRIYKLCHEVLLNEGKLLDNSLEKKITQKFKANQKKGLLIFYGKKEERLIPIVILNIDNPDTELIVNKKGFKQFNQEKFEKDEEIDNFLKKFVGMIYEALPKNNYPDKKDFITFLKEITPDNKSLSAVKKIYKQYNNQGVSGILGEIRGAIFFNKGLKAPENQKNSKGETKIIGSETSSSGQRAVDVLLEVKNNKNFENGIGLLVKNYVYSNNELQLYSTDLTLLSSKYLGRYLYKEYIELLTKFLKNYQFDKYYDFFIEISNSLMTQLCFNIDSFLRIKQMDAKGENLFFLVNSLYYPSSYVLRLLLLTIEKEKEKTIGSFFNINDSKNCLYFQGHKTDRNQHLLKSKNILSDNKISFKGLTIPIKSLTKG